jgi:hypothetical protein
MSTHQLKHSARSRCRAGALPLETGIQPSQEPWLGFFTLDGPWPHSTLLSKTVHAGLSYWTPLALALDMPVDNPDNPEVD